MWITIFPIWGTVKAFCVQKSRFHFGVLCFPK
nr:MAG TPA: hypothetical protein [Caudoviricetes sp.]